MNIKQIVIKQYQDIVNAKVDFRNMSIPIEGWLRTARKALNMSGSQLARRIGVSRAWVSKVEISELNGTVTLQSMARIANAMNCHFVYAVVPKQQVEEILLEHALKKASKIVQQANLQMALEDQTVDNDMIQFEIKRIARKLVDDMPLDFWDES